VRTFVYRNRRHDPKTGLLTRRWFHVHVRRAGRRGSRHAVLVGELQGWRELASVHGHAPGEAALLAAYRVVARAVPEDVRVARFGWLDFGVFVPGDEQRAREVAEKIQRALADTPVVEDEPDRRFGAFIGVDSNRWFDVNPL
jgi:GGDEF domain-containing protein